MEARFGTKEVLRQLVPIIGCLDNYMETIELYKDVQEGIENMEENAMLPPAQLEIDINLYAGTRILMSYKRYKNKLTGSCEITWNNLLTRDDEAFVWLVLKNARKYSLKSA